MIVGLVRKTLRETWIQALLFGLALAAIEALLTLVLPQLQQGLNEVLSALPFVRNFIRTLMGGDFGDNVTPQALLAIVWVHPIVLAVTWAQEIIFCTRLPAGEIDRATIDVLLSWPASRRRIFACEAAVWLACGLWLMALLGLGHAVAAWVAPNGAQPPAGRVVIVLVNLYCLYLAVGGLAWFVSAVSNYRGRAMATVFAVVVASFLLNFLAQFWQPARALAPLGVLTYYQPAQILDSGVWPLAHLAVLSTAGAIFWLAALETFARRNICTV